MSNENDIVKPFFEYPAGMSLATVRNFQEIERILSLQVDNNEGYTGNTETVDDGLADHLADYSNPHLRLSNVSNILSKFDATVAPTVNDDSGDGYSVGSFWFDVTNDKAYGCVDPTLSHAKWTELTQSGGGGSTFTSLFEATLSADDTIGNSAQEKVLFDTVTYDANSDWNVANKRWVCPTTGKYMCVASLRYEVNGAGLRGAYIYVDGAEVDSNLKSSYATYNCRVLVSKILNLTVNNYVEIYAWQNSGGDLDVISHSNSFFQIFGPILT